MEEGEHRGGGKGMRYELTRANFILQQVTKGTSAWGERPRAREAGEGKEK